MFQIVQLPTLSVKVEGVFGNSRMRKYQLVARLHFGLHEVREVGDRLIKVELLVVFFGRLLFPLLMSSSINLFALFLLLLHELHEEVLTVAFVVLHQLLHVVRIVVVIFLFLSRLLFLRLGVFELVQLHLVRVLFYLFLLTHLHIPAP